MTGEGRVYASQYGHIPAAMEQAPKEADPFAIARDLERELAAVTAERDEAIAWMRVVGEEIAIAGHRSGDRAETLAGLRCLREERDRMRPVVEAAQKWRDTQNSYYPGNGKHLIDAVDTYEAAK